MKRSTVLSFGSASARGSTSPQRLEQNIPPLDEKARARGDLGRLLGQALAEGQRDVRRADMAEKRASRPRRVRIVRDAISGKLILVGRIRRA